MRLHQEGDAGALQRIYSQDDVARYLLDEPWAASEAERRVSERVRQVGLDQDGESLALIIEHHGVVIGDVLLWLTNAEHRIAEIGWVMDPPTVVRAWPQKQCKPCWS